MNNKIVLTDKGVSDRCSKSLAVLDYVVVRLPSFKDLPSPIASHPDMLMAHLPDGKILTSRKYFELAEDILSELPVNWILTDEPIQPIYPHDILFDALTIGDTLIGKIDSVSEYLRSSYGGHINVKQGYTRCSTAMLSDECAVTADKGIADALESIGVDVLRISAGNVKLKGYDTGFIGGAGGRLSDGKYVFFGDIMSHPDGDKIVRFAEKHKISTVSLSDEPLCDCGGLLVI